MIRTSLASLALFALIGAPVHADEPKAKAKELTVEEAKQGYRVYTVTLRCQTRRLQSVHADLYEASAAANDLRKKNLQVEVTTGSEGKKLPSGRPEVYHVFARACKAWSRARVVHDAKQAEELAKKHRDGGDEVLVVHDYAPKALFHVYAGDCKFDHLQGTYLTANEAFEAAAAFRASHKDFRCFVAVGTRGEKVLVGDPPQYVVYDRGCKGGWKVGITTKDRKKAEEAAAGGRQVKGEVVHQYVSK